MAKDPLIVCKLCVSRKPQVRLSDQVLSEYLVLRVRYPHFERRYKDTCVVKGDSVDTRSCLDIHITPHSRKDEINYSAASLFREFYLNSLL